MIDIWIEAHSEFFTFENQVSATVMTHCVLVNDGTDVSLSAPVTTGIISITASQRHWENAIEEAITNQATADGYNIVRLMLTFPTFLK